MQTPAEKYLIKKVAEVLQTNKSSSPLKILNIGAGKSLVIEKNIASEDYEYICDRVDVIDCAVDYPSAGKCFKASVESMPSIESEKYLLAFANYVLEHVADLDKAAKEIHRVLMPDGFLILSLPNPAAPEFVLSKFTPLRFHQFIKGEGEGQEAFETHYAFKNIDELIEVFEKNNYTLVETQRYSFTYGYLYRFPVIHVLSQIYDKIVNSLKLTSLMGNVGIVFKK